MTQQRSGASQRLHQEGGPLLFFIPDVGNGDASRRGDGLWSGAMVVLMIFGCSGSRCSFPLHDLSTPLSV